MINPACRRILLFDIDGTLLLSGGAGMRSLNKAIEFVTGQKEAMTDVIPDGKTDFMIVEEAFRVNFLEMGFGPEEIHASLEKYLPIMEEEVAASDKFRIMPGAGELLEQCSRRVQCMLGIATGNIEEGANISLRRAGFMKYFSFGGYGSDSTDRTELVKIAVERGRQQAGVQLKPEQFYVIGDTPHDIICAKRAGVRSIGVGAARFNCEELSAYEPDYVLPDLTNARLFFECLGL